jgi:hypothetical protein
MTSRNHIGVADPDDTTRKILEAYITEWQKRHGLRLTLSDAIRLTASESLINIRKERAPKLQDKLTSGKLRK